MARRVEGVVVMYSEESGVGAIKARENLYWFDIVLVVLGENQTIVGATVEFEVSAFHIRKAIGIDVLQVGSHRCMDHANGLERYATFNEATASSSVSNSAQASGRVVTTPKSRASNINAGTNGTSHPDVIDLVTPVKRQRTESRLWEDFGDLCIGESLSSDELISKRVKEAEENGGPNFVDLSDE